MKQYWVYIMMNVGNTVMYIGATNNLEKRVNEHKSELIDGFTKKYKIKKLVYYEEYPQIKDALIREKQLKNWHREWKLNLIKSVNSDFKDLSEI